MQYRHWTLWCDRCHQYITPLLEDHSLHLMVKEDPWGRGEIGFYSSIQHSEWKAMLVNINGELLQFVKSHIIFMFLPIALKKFEEYMKCCLLSNVQVSKNSFSRVYRNSENELLFPFEIELPSVPDHERINPLTPYHQYVSSPHCFSKNFLLS